MKDRDLKVNSLSRYQKDSPQFVLEAHDHCEVPAGCGGVVLRWWNPARGFPVEMRLYSPWECDFFLDGRPAANGRPVLALGEHLVAFRIRAADLSHGLLMFAGVYDEEDSRLSRKTGRSLKVLSAGGAGWKYTLSEPSGESWMQPGFDDSDWSEMVEKPVPDPGKAKYACDRLTKLGALGIGLQEATAAVPAEGEQAVPIWIRKAFTV